MTGLVPRRENAKTKANRLLVEGRLIVTELRDQFCTATCRSDGVMYRLGYVGGEWRCNCEARGECSHLLALKHVVAVDLARP